MRSGLRQHQCIHEFNIGECGGRFRFVKRLEQHFDLSRQRHDRSVQHGVVRKDRMGIQAHSAFPDPGFGVDGRFDPPADEGVRELTAGLICHAVQPVSFPLPGVCRQGNRRARRVHQAIPVYFVSMDVALPHRFQQDIPGFAIAPQRGECLPGPVQMGEVLIYGR